SHGNHRYLHSFPTRRSSDLFDGRWFETAGVDSQKFLEVVKNTITDGEVCDWVLKNVKQPDSVKAAHRERMLNYPKKDDPEMQARSEEHTSELQSPCNLVCRL